MQHTQLFEKLIRRGVPMCFVRLLKHWYSDQTMRFKWGSHLSDPFRVSNGVRQEGVLSPCLFAVYLDELSNELNNVKAGCYIGDVLLNHLMLADDICVFCPSVRYWSSSTAKRLSSICRFTWNYFQLQQNCFYDL